jgi:hypothetical protein
MSMDHCREGTDKVKLNYSEYKPLLVPMPSNTDTTYIGLGSMTDLFLEKLHNENV